MKRTLLLALLLTFALSACTVPPDAGAQKVSLTVVGAPGA